MEASIRGLMPYKLWNDNDMNKNIIGGNVERSDDVKVYSFSAGARAIILTGPLNLLLIAVPIGIIGYFAGWNDGVVFAFSLLAIAPLAERLGFCTEQVAIHTNDSIGGLLNATFGNATELIVAISALARGLYRVVQLSLLGSILSNMLLVLGCAFYFGGLRFKEQKFNKVTSQINSPMLMLATMSCLFPAVLTLSNTENSDGELLMSRAVSLFLLMSYGLFIYFQVINSLQIRILMIFLLACNT